MIGQIIANNIRAERTRVRMSQDYVASALGISRKTYISYEEDASLIKASTLYKLATILGCSINDFFYSITSQNVNNN